MTEGQGIGKIEFFIAKVERSRAPVLPKAAFACPEGSRAIEAQFHVALQDDVEYSARALCIEARTRLADHFNAVDVGGGHVFQETLHVHVLRRTPVDEDGKALLASQTDAVIDHNHTRHFAQYIQGTTAGSGDAVGHVDDHGSGFLFQKGFAGGNFRRGQGFYIRI